MSKKITSKLQNYSQWYNDIVKFAGLADHSDVKGCMIIKPHGYALWENIQQNLDQMFKRTGHQNVYFPLFVPKSYLSKEAEHVKGFAKECAVVTHYRLKEEDGKVVVDPDAKLEDELIVRPTSETIIWNTYRKWIQSYRDLPLLYNQWANVVRWEMRTRLFLRTAEFLWQEGHTAHATKEEAIAETKQMLEVYATFAEEVLAMPVIKGLKTEKEKFAGAVDTYCIEALMQDGKALQAGTSHYLGQNFPKAFDVKFTDKSGTESHVWATSWGVSTRLIGGLIMTHSDDQGLVLPPKIAPIQVVIVPIFRNEEQQQALAAYAAKIQDALENQGVRVKYDDDDQKKPGWKFNEYEMKGVPIRLAIGPRDLENEKVELARRDLGTKTPFPLQEVLDGAIPKMLSEIQTSLFEKAKTFRTQHTHQVDDWKTFQKLIKADAGFIYAHWDGTTATEEAIKKATKADIRCIPLDAPEESGKCIYSGKPSNKRVIFAKAY